MWQGEGPDHQGASGIAWSSSRPESTFAGGAEYSVLYLPGVSARRSLLLWAEGRGPGVLEVLSTTTESSSASSGGGEKVQIYVQKSAANSGIRTRYFELTSITVRPERFTMRTALSSSNATLQTSCAGVDSSRSS